MDFNETFADSCFNGTSESLSFNNLTTESPFPPCHMFKDPSYYALPYRVIGTIFQGFILVVGE